jgi:hypothetical protein
MTLANTALVTLNQAKAFLKIDPAVSLHIDAEYVGVGDNNATVFTLDHAPLTGTYKVWTNTAGTPALKVETTDYSISSTTLTFVVKPAAGVIITASYDYAAATDTFESYDDDILERLIEAATKKAEDYCGRRFINVAETEQHTGDGTKILRLYRRPINSITSVVYKKVDAFTGDGSTLVYTLSESGTLHAVYVAGTLKTVTTHYAVSGTTLTFTGGNAPADDAEVVVRYSVTVTHIDYEEFLSIGRLKGTWYKDYIYEVVYSAGYGADRATVQPLIPDAVMGVLVILANLYNNRVGVESEFYPGNGSTSYTPIPELAKQHLHSLKV